MNPEKEIISAIIHVEHWAEFEEFIQNLYSKNNSVVHIEKNYKVKGKSGRLREVDVLVKFGINPHIISLGIECKYWTEKVDGDVIDVAFGKKDDLNIDKFVVITTVGFEAGAELYAQSKGIDIFIIRPTNDDDFGYTGKLVKFKFETYGSRPLNIGAGLTVIAEKGKEAQVTDYVSKKISNIKFTVDDDDCDHSIDLYRYTKIDLKNDITQFIPGKYVDNFAKVIQKNWSNNNVNFYKGDQFYLQQKVLFKEPTAMFVDKIIPVPINEINFEIQYLRHDWEFEIDRSSRHPVILENVIENAITPLKLNNVNGKQEFEMDQTIPNQKVDLSKKPNDAVGRDGVNHPGFIEAYFN